MKKMMRKGLVLAGMAAALALLPKGTRAQEISNTEFAYGPNVTALVEPAAQQVAESKMALSPSEAYRATVAVAKMDQEQTKLTELAAPAGESWIAAMLTSAAGLIAWYGVAVERTSRKMQGSRQNVSTQAV